MENNENNYDVIIIGGGVTGSAAAWQLAQTDLKVLVLEKEEDVCEGTSKANSGICHAGFDALPGSLKAKLNVQGNLMMPKLAETLGFEYQPNGSLVLCFDETSKPDLEKLYERGVQNGVKGLEIWDRNQILEHEPNIADGVVYALWAPTAGIVDPFGLNIALAENAADNGVTFLFNTPAQSIEQTENGWKINDIYTAPVVINAAGVYGDVIHNMAIPEKPLEITPRKGEYFLLDHNAIDLVSSTLFQLPSAMGKGVLVTPTVHGNILIGPTADNQKEKWDTSTTAEGLNKVHETALKSVKNIPFNQTITSFAGLRAVGPTGDFIIEEVRDGWIDAIGMESPGLSAAPAAGIMIREIIEKKLKPGKNPNYKAERKGFIQTSHLSRQEWNELIEKDPAWGNMICRCEQVSEGAIVDALTRSVPAVSLDGIKRRVRPGSGRCQGGFCWPKVMEIIARVQNRPMETIEKSGKGSEILVGKNKELTGYDNEE